MTQITMTSGLMTVKRECDCIEEQDGRQSFCADCNYQGYVEETGWFVVDVIPAGWNEYKGYATYHYLDHTCVYSDIEIIRLVTQIYESGQPLPVGCQWVKE